MPTFQYEALNNVGQQVKGEMDASTSEDVIAKLRAQGNFPTNIKEKSGAKSAARNKSSSPPKQAQGRGRPQPAAAATPQRRQVGRVSKKLLTTFTRQLAVLVDAGLPILRSLKILEQQQKPGMLRIAIRLVAEDVEGGSTLSEAMARHPKAYDRLYTNMVQAGELGGVLDIILNRLADFMEKSQRLKRKVIGAMVYPVAVMTFAFLIVTGLMIWIVPSFETIFKDMGTGLPAPTRFLLDTSIWMRSWGWIVMILFPIMVYIGIKILKTSPGGAYFIDNIKINIPLFGRIISKTSIARFSRTLGTLLTAGVPILEALQITRDTAGNEVYSRALARVHEGIREGESIADPLRAARIVEPMVVNMIDVGEETGELDKMLNKVADVYDDEVETLVAGMVSLMEPILVISLGVIVGGIVIALFLPMVHMIEAVQKQ